MSGEIATRIRRTKEKHTRWTDTPKCSEGTISKELGHGAATVFSFGGSRIVREHEETC